MTTGMKMTNADLRKMVFDEITKCGFKIKDVENVDGYFVSDFGKDSVTHFRVKGKGMWKHWKFGLWCFQEYLDDEYLKENNINKKDAYVIQLFAQYDTWIDKFKPSRSEVCIRISAEDFEFCESEDDYKMELWDIKRMLTFMCKHPLMAYNGFCGEYAGFYTGSFLWNFIRCEWHTKWQDIKRFFKTTTILPYIKLKVKINSHNKLVDKIILYNFEKETGCTTDNDWQIDILFKEDANEDEITEYLDKKWKEHYGEYSYYSYVVGLGNAGKVKAQRWWY